MYQGVDVSFANGQIDWEKAKQHIDFAIIRCGFGMNQEDQDDVQYHRNVQECIRLKIPFGIYLYSYATNEEKTKTEKVVATKRKSTTKTKKSSTENKNLTKSKKSDKVSKGKVE